MPFYIKQPITIVEAYKITVNNIEELTKRMNGTEVVKRTDGSYVGIRMPATSSLVASLGDYIIKKAPDVFYFCDGRVFEETYEVIS